MMEASKSDSEQIMALSSWLMHKHYCENDVEAIIEKMDDHIVWVGAGENEYATGRECVAEIFRKFAGQIPKCNISRETYDVLLLAEGVYLCTGHMWIATDPISQVYLQVHQRVSMIFRLGEQGFRCCHIHASNPYQDMVEEDVGFPMKVAQQTYEYLQEQVRCQKEQIENQTELLKRMSFEDSLTGVFNRNKFNQCLDASLDGERLVTGVACFDLNGLKEVNDHLGHSAGDLLICNAAHQICAVFPGCVYRIGGDEFVVIDHTLEKDKFCTAIREVQQTMIEHHISCSVGISWRNTNCNIKEQYDEADDLMYQEKRQYHRSQGKRKYYRRNHTKK